MSTLTCTCLCVHANHGTHAPRSEAQASTRGMLHTYATHLLPPPQQPLGRQPLLLRKAPLLLLQLQRTHLHTPPRQRALASPREIGYQRFVSQAAEMRRLNSPAGSPPG